MANLLKRLMYPFMGSDSTPTVGSPFVERGVSGTTIDGSFIRNREKSGEWVGTKKWQTIQELVTNISIVAASVHHFVNLVAHPDWKVIPASDSDEDKQYADFIEDVMYDMTTTWPRIVRRSAMYRFNGFGIQEWTAKRRDDGRIGFEDIETRPCHTIENWSVDERGTVDGIWQTDPQSNNLIGLSRKKIIYLVEDTLTDSPEGLGVFRHLGESYNRLKELQTLEQQAFERDLRGTPVGRVPYTLLRQALAANQITQAQHDSLISGIENIVSMQVKSSNTGILLDSVPYTAQAQDGEKPTSLYQWGLELLQGNGAGLEELNTAIDRLQREMARVCGTEHLMMGGERYTGNRALSQDKSRNLYLIANATLTYIADAYRNDIIMTLWRLNGLPKEKMPWLTVEDVTFKDVEGVAAVLKDMAAAGAVLSPDDPVIDDVRDLLGISNATPIDMALFEAMNAPAMGREKETTI